MANRFLKTLMGNWSLEQKSLVFIGLALLCSLVVTFTAVQVVASRLVMETTRQSARDYANAALGWKHITSYGQLSGVDDQAGTDRNAWKMQLLKALRPSMLHSRYESEVLMLSDGLDHETLASKKAVGDDLVRMNRIHAKLAERDSILAESKLAAEKAASAAETTASNGTGEPKSLAAPIFIVPPTENTYVFEEAGPSNGFYYYYHPVSFDKTCMVCHAKLPSSIDSVTTSSIDPFRVIRVKMPYNDTQVWNIWSYSVLTSIGICTLALSLFFVDWVL